MAAGTLAFLSLTARSSEPRVFLADRVGLKRARTAVAGRHGIVASNVGKKDNWVVIGYAPLCSRSIREWASWHCCVYLRALV